jgi:hypothetical protein
MGRLLKPIAIFEAISAVVDKSFQIAVDTSNQ